MYEVIVSVWLIYNLFDKKHNVGYRYIYWSSMTLFKLSVLYKEYCLLCNLLAISDNIQLGYKNGYVRVTILSAKIINTANEWWIC